MTSAEEDYVHYVECIDTLNQAWSILQDLRATEQRNALTAAAYRFALIEYAKPYTSSDGVHRNRKKRNSYKLPVPPGLSPEDLALHQEIVVLRDQALAHSDLTFKEAIIYCGRYDGQLHAGIMSNGVFELPAIEAVIGLIERILPNMYLEGQRRLEELGKTVSI